MTNHTKASNVQTDTATPFDVMADPDYPATCVRCGETGTNQSMEQHVCGQSCPWCDSKLQVHDNPALANDIVMVIHAPDCFLALDGNRQIIEMDEIPSWNARPAYDTLRAENAALRAALEAITKKPHDSVCRYWHECSCYVGIATAALAAT